MFASFERYRGPLIARTETIAAVNFADVDAVEQSGVADKLQKHWLSSRDGAVRDTHLAAENRYAEKGIGVDELFEVGEDVMVAPGNGSVAAENVNCRCTLTYSRRE